VIVAFDFFTVPTVTFQLLYCFFVIAHGRRKILYFNVTRHPTADWVVQQLREAFPEAAPYRHAIFDRDSKFDADVIAFLKATLPANVGQVEVGGNEGVFGRLEDEAVLS
jgi:putative transposase